MVGSEDLYLRVAGRPLLLLNDREGVGGRCRPLGSLIESEGGW